MKALDDLLADDLVCINQIRTFAYTRVGGALTSVGDSQQRTAHEFSLSTKADPKRRGLGGRKFPIWGLCP